jgi:hypothetical protein
MQEQVSIYFNAKADIKNESESSIATGELEPSLKNIMLCKKVYADHHGHNTYIGEFKTIRVNSVPAVRKELFIVTKWGDGRGLDFRQEIKIIYPQNSLVIFSSDHLEKEFDLGNIYHEHVIAGRISNLLLPGVGRYRIEVHLDGELKGRTYLNVALR